MPLDPDFVADSPYGPGGLLLDEILEVDRERGLVVARMATSGDLPLTREQRTDPVRHPPHLNGGLLVHMTGMLGFVHAWYTFEFHQEGTLVYEGDQSAMWLRTG